MYRKIFLFWFFCASVEGSSSGDISICDAHSTAFGCDEHGLNEDGSVNRLNCTEKNPGIMHWALRPKSTSAYTVTGPTAFTSEYVPDVYLKIKVQVKDYNWKYRGLLLHAVDHTGKTVGTWGLPNEPNFPFWHPTNCGEQYVLHNAAEEKALSSTFYFKTPPAGTGVITFRSIFKKGPANEGSFHYPANNLRLLEQVQSGSSSSSSKWLLAQAAQSCTVACRQANLYCNNDALNLNANVVNHHELLEKLFPCSMQISDGCSNGKCTKSAKRVGCITCIWKDL